MKNLRLAIAAISAIFSALKEVHAQRPVPDDPIAHLRHPTPPDINDWSRNWTCQVLPDSPWRDQVERAIHHFSKKNLLFCGTTGGCNVIYRSTDDERQARQDWGLRVEACGSRETYCTDVADMLATLRRHCGMQVYGHFVVGGAHWYGHTAQRDSYVWIGLARDPDGFVPAPPQIESGLGSSDVGEAHRPWLGGDSLNWPPDS